MKTRTAIIVAAKVIGYSRLIAVDRVRTASNLKVNVQSVIRPRVDKYNGRIIELLDDRALFEFKTTAEAVSFAVDAQSTLKQRDVNVRGDKIVLYRYGVAVGEVTDDGKHVIGDAVDIAKGLEEISAPGGVCISGTVYEEIGGTLSLDYNSQGERALKNVADPVSVFRIAINQKAAELAAKAALPPGPSKTTLPPGMIAAVLVVLAVAAGVLWWQPWSSSPTTSPTGEVELPAVEKPSIAVLPFESLTPDANTRILASGMTAAILGALAQVPQLFVTGRHSISAFDGTGKDVRAVGEALGVGYILDGTLQQDNDRLRVLVELMDTSSGELVWAERYDREIEDVFELQDEIALRVLVALQVRLTEGLQAAIRGESTNKVEAYLALIKAQHAFRTMTRESMDQVRRLTDQVLELDPSYRQALVLKARSHVIDARMGHTAAVSKSLDQASKILEDAAMIDGVVSDAERAEMLIVGAYIDQVNERYDRAVETTEQAVDLAPNSADVLATAGMILFFNRESQRAETLLRRAMRLSPAYPAWYALYISRAYAFLGQFDPAIRWARDALNRADGDFVKAVALSNLAFIYELAGRDKDAKEAATRVADLAPSFSIANYGKTQPYRYFDDWDRYADALRAAGIQD